MASCDLGELGQGEDFELPGWVDMMLHFRKAANATLGMHDFRNYIQLGILLIKFMYQSWREYKLYLYTDMGPSFGSLIFLEIPLIIVVWY